MAPRTRPCNQARDDTEHQTDQHRQPRDPQGDARAADDPRQQVATEMVRAQPVVRGRSFHAAWNVDRGRAVRRDPRREKRDHDDPSDDCDPERSGATASNPAYEPRHRTELARPCVRGDHAAHDALPSLVRGSSAQFATSASRFATTNKTATVTTPPRMTGKFRSVSAL